MTEMEIGFTTLPRVCCVQVTLPPPSKELIDRVLARELANNACFPMPRQTGVRPSPPEYIVPMLTYYAYGEMPITDGPAYDSNALLTEAVRWANEYLEVQRKSQSK